MVCVYVCERVWLRVCVRDCTYACLRMNVEMVGYEEGMARRSVYGVVEMDMDMDM